MNSNRSDRIESGSVKQKDKKIINEKRKKRIDEDIEDMKQEEVFKEGKRIGDIIRLIAKDDLEFRFACVVRQGSQSLLLDAVVDTGCGSGYIVGNACGLETYEVLFPVVMADGSVSKVTQAVKVRITVGDETKDVVLRILKSQIAEPYILFGRSLIKLFNVAIAGGQIMLGDKLLHDSAFLLDEIVNEQDFIELPGAESGERGRVVVSISDAKRQDTRRLLESILDRPWELVYCPKSTMVLKKVSPNDRKDTAEQEFIFELSLPPLENTEGMKNRFYSENMVRRLAPQDRLEFDKLVQAYLDQGWWCEAPREVCEQVGTLTANVFPVKATGKKMRLVSDFRPLNGFYPSSSRLTRVFCPIFLLRTVRTESLVVGDCKSAFYRIRLARPVWVHAGGRDFLCHRMAFGLSMGPEGLGSSLGEIWKHWFSQVAQGPGFAGLFVDDFFLTKEEEVGSLLCILGLCGFEVSLEKFQYCKPVTKLLGATIERSGEDIVLHCGDEERVEEIQKQLLTVRVRPTKASVFSLAGRVGYDVCHMHPERRLIADMIRSIAGRSPSQWHEPLNLAERGLLLFSQLLDWLEEILSHEKCLHLTNPCFPRMYLRIETDASRFGYGFVIKHRGSESAKWMTVYSDSAVWNKAQANYHINRQEGFSLLMGMRVACFCVRYIMTSSLSNTVVEPYLQIITDSTTALSWTRSGEAQAGLSHKSVEMRSILSLAEALHQEWVLLRKLCSSVTLEHVSGENNGDADRLSRLMYRTVGSSTFGDLWFDSKPRKGETVAVVGEQEYPLIQRIAEDSADLIQFCWRLTCYRSFILHGVGKLKIFPTFNEFDAFAAENVKYYGKAIQRMCQIRPNGPYINIEGVLYFEECRFRGETVRRVVIPSNSRTVRVRELILKFFHRKNWHRGRRYDVAALNDSVFYVEGVDSIARMVISRCLICARKNASSRSAYGMPVQVVQREITLPPFSRVSVDFVHHRGITILSAVCTDTGVLFLTIVEAATAKGAIAGLRRLSQLYCVHIKRVHSDNAQAFSKTFQAEANREWAGIEFSNRAPHVSQQNPVERSHREMWSLLRARKFTRALDDDNQDLSNETLEEVCGILNRRPLGLFPDGTVITPAVLAWGANHTSGAARLQEVRKYFYENIFAIYRRRHLPKRQVRRSVIFVGQKVLYQYGPSDKMDYAHGLGTVVGIHGAVVHVRAQGKTLQVGTGEVIPLGDFFQSTISPGGHVVELGENEGQNSE